MRHMTMAACSLLVIIGLAAEPAAAYTQGEIHQMLIEQEVGKYGPLDCGITFILFRQETTKQIKNLIAQEGRETLFDTPNGTPYPFEKISIDDLLELRGLLRVEDDAHRAIWDERIRERASAAYEDVQ